MDIDFLILLVKGGKLSLVILPRSLRFQSGEHCGQVLIQTNSPETAKASEKGRRRILRPCSLRMKFVLFIVIFIITFTSAYSIRCYQCIQGIPVHLGDTAYDIIQQPLPKNLSLPGVDQLPTEYCKTPFELKGNILCIAARRCMKSVTYEKDIKFTIRYCAPTRNDGYEINPSPKKPVDITNGCHKFRAYICDTELCNGASSSVVSTILFIVILPFLFM